MNTKMTKLAMAIGAMAMAGAAMATTDGSTLAVSATVSNNCAISNGTIAFSTIQLAANKGVGTIGTTAAAAANSGSTISVICTNGASAAITGGLGSNGSGAIRKMIGGPGPGTDLLTYELYSDSLHTTVFNTSNSIAYAGTGLATSVIIYGGITGADIALAKAGSYADSVPLTITYTP
jgi:spore coat protein U-like protein